MAYLLLTNPQIIEAIQNKGAYFFHGTNANALPTILKYGINSVDTSIENNIAVTTGEKFSRINGKRDFVSLTDCLDVALSYATRNPTDNNSTDSLLNFDVVIGTSLENMNGLRFVNVISYVPEIGVIGNLPIEHIKFLIVPDDKTEFVRKMVGQKDIEVMSMDTRDAFFFSTSSEKLNILEQNKENKEQVEPPYPTYSKDDVKKLVNTRKTPQIKRIFEILKSKMHMHNKKTDDKNISERS